MYDNFTYYNITADGNVNNRISREENYTYLLAYGRYEKEVEFWVLPLPYALAPRARLLVSFTSFKRNNKYIYHGVNSFITSK